MRLRILSPSAVVAEMEVESVTVPGMVGEFTAMDGHDSLLSLVREGALRCVRRVSRGDSKEERFSIGHGLAEVIHDLVTVCVAYAHRCDGAGDEGRQS